MSKWSKGASNMMDPSTQPEDMVMVRNCPPCIFAPGEWRSRSVAEMGVAEWNFRCLRSLSKVRVGVDTWNLFVLYFLPWPLQNKVFSNQKQGHLGSR